MGRIGCIRCEKSWRDFAARAFALIALVHPVLHRVSCSYETITNAPKHCETHQNMSLGSNGVDQVLWLWKITTRLRGTNICINCTSSVCFATSSCSYEKIPNAPKYYETHQNISLGCNGADWVHSLRRILMWLRVTNFFINCTSSPRFAPSFIELRNDNKCTQTLWNAPKQEFRVQWGGPSALVAKNYNATSWHKLLHLLH